MVKVLHLLSDHKFVEGHLARFEQAQFENTFVFISEKESYTGESAFKLKQIVPFSTDYERLIIEASACDIVFVYKLDYLKSIIINRLSKNVIVIWYFYGTELYNELSRLKYNIYSQKTKALLGIDRITIIAAKLKKIGSLLKYKFLKRSATYTVIAEAIKRVNYFTTFSKEEYDYLQVNSDFQLPKFLSLPVYTRDVPQRREDKKYSYLLLGHSATPDANHADVVDLLSAFEYSGNVIVPLSYGENENYTRLIRQRLQQSGLQIKILEGFMDRSSYSKVVNTCSAAIFNSYRQLAVGNILLAIRNNVKVYLNDANPTLQWLLNCGFKVFSIQKNLESDIKSKSLFLQPEEAEYNRSIYEKIDNEENNRMYLERIEDIGLQNQKHLV